MTAQQAGREVPTYVTLEHAAQITEQSVKTIRRRIGTCDRSRSDRYPAGERR